MEKMESNNTQVSNISLPMNGGDGPYSYARNSSYQKEGIDSAKALIHEEIARKLNVKQLCSSSNLFKMADLGCSIGPNTFIIVQNIIEAIEYKSQSQGLTPKHFEYQVFFNDQTTNDFNTLFRSAPPQKNYYAFGVPGSFHGRLFPKSSLHFVHSSYALHWLSKVPKEVWDRKSPAWNKGRIHHGARKEVNEAYAAQFGKDVECFLDARAQELKSGGFMVILLPCIPDGVNLAKCTMVALLDLMGSTLLDLAQMGLVNEDDVDSFNVPFYNASPSHFKLLIERNGCFKIHTMQELGRPLAHASRPNVEKFSLVMRAGFEALIERHLGCEIMDDLFSQYKEKLVESCIFSDSSYVPMTDLFLLHVLDK